MKRQRTEHKKEIMGLSLWPGAQGLKILTASKDGDVQMWDPTTWASSGTIACGGEVHSIVVEENWLFVGFEAVAPELPGVPVGFVRGWNLTDPAHQHQFIVDPASMPYSHATAVTALAATIQGGMPVVLSGSKDGSMRMWGVDQATQRFASQAELRGHVRGVTKLLLIPSTLHAGAMLSASLDHTIRMWDLTTQTCMGCVTSAQEGHAGAVYDLVYFPLADAHYIISCGQDKMVKVWQLGPGAAGAAAGAAPAALALTHSFGEQQALAPKSLCGVVDADSVTPMLLLGLDNGELLVKQLPDFNNLLVLRPNQSYGHTGCITCIAMGPECTFFTGSVDRKFMAWQISQSIVQANAGGGGGGGRGGGY